MLKVSEGGLGDGDHDGGAIYVNENNKDRLARAAATAYVCGETGKYGGDAIGGMIAGPVGVGVAIGGSVGKVVGTVAGFIGGLFDW